MAPTQFSVTSYSPYTDLSDKLWTPYTKLSDKLWPPYTNFSDNRHKEFEVKVKNDGEIEVFHNVHHVHLEPEAFLHHKISCLLKAPLKRTNYCQV